MSTSFDILKVTLVAAISAQLLSTAAAQTPPSEISISEAELIKFKYLLKDTHLSLEQLLQYHLSKGNISIESGKVRVHLSNYDLIKQNNGIDKAQERKSTICARTRGE